VSTGVNVPVECDVCLKTVTQVGPSVLVCSHDEYAMTVQFPWLANGELHHRDLVVLVNKNAALQFDLVQKCDKYHHFLASNFVYFLGLMRKTFYTVMIVV
jgi:hypothetical protein